MADRRKTSQWPEIFRYGRPEAPSLAAWILRSAEYAEGLSAVARIAAIARVSEPTVRAGGPITQDKRAQFVERLLDAHVRTVSCGANEDVDIAAHLRGATYPTLFSGFAGGYNPHMLDLCDAMDRVSEAVATGQWSWSRGAEAVVEIGRLAAPRTAQAFPVAPDDLIALDAMLLVLAKLDIQVLLDHQHPDYPVKSLFLRVSPKLRDGTIERWPYARLLDRMYVLTCFKHGQPLETGLPTIRRLDAVLGTTPENGAKSKVGHWRAGRAMRRTDFDEIAVRCLGDDIKHFVAKKLYVGATFWHALVKEAPEHVEWALERFGMWWSLFRPENFVDGVRAPHPFNVIA